MGCVSLGFDVLSEGGLNFAIFGLCFAVNDFIILSLDI